MPRRLALAAAVTLLLSGCGIGSSLSVTDVKILPCPREAIIEPECSKPPAPGTKRSQPDVFANELACYRQALAWRLGWEACGG